MYQSQPMSRTLTRSLAGLLLVSVAGMTNAQDRLKPTLLSCIWTSGSNNHPTVTNFDITVDTQLGDVYGYPQIVVPGCLDHCKCVVTESTVSCSGNSGQGAVASVMQLSRHTGYLSVSTLIRDKKTAKINDYKTTYECRIAKPRKF
jgi:hypothetical protein